MSWSWGRDQRNWLSRRHWYREAVVQFCLNEKKHCAVHGVDTRIDWRCTPTKRDRACRECLLRVPCRDMFREWLLLSILVLMHENFGFKPEFGADVKFLTRPAKGWKISTPDARDWNANQVGGSRAGRRDRAARPGISNVIGASVVFEGGGIRAGMIPMR